MEAQLIVQCFLVFLICLIISAVCVTGKFAFAQLRREYLEELIRDGDVSLRPLLSLYDKPIIFLATAQLGMALSGLVAGAAGFCILYSLYGLLEPYVGHVWILWLIDVVVAVILCFILWVFGELIPKSVGLQRPEKSLRMVHRLIHPWSHPLLPFIVFGNGLGRLILADRGLDVTNEIDLAHSEDEIRMLITASHKEGKIDQVESELIGNVFDFADLLAKEIMVPRQDIVCLYTEETMHQHLQTIRQSRHTRYPLCEDDKDHILGLVHIKDIMDLYIHKRSNLNLIKRPILTIPEIMPASKLLQLMRMRRTYLAMVVDEYGSTVGLIGLEDILEELVGAIQNEHTHEKEEIQPLPDGAYEFAGTVLLDDVEELLHIPVEEDVDTDTIGGYVFNALGHTPIVHDEVTIGNYRFEVLEMQRFRIVRLKAVPIPPPPAADAGPGEGDGDSHGD
ncbi:hemolysin family protein [uncultured Megasphaera sp.]|mgnify:FL=1|uniref:hemolysin family protein n=1 Tax=Megasphaera massiliensis TaxID=1232428 RepID=UPI00266BC1BD|nr:hemolysin family protein [uncultured Megasphaera sp.]